MGLLLGFFLSSRPVYAYDFPDYVVSSAGISYSNIWWELTDFEPLAYEGYSNNGTGYVYYSELVGVADLYIHITDYLSCDLSEIDNSNSSYTLNGQGRLVKEFYIDVAPANNDQQLNIDNITLVDYSISGDNFIIEQDLSTRTRGNSTKYNTNDSYYYRFSRNVLINVQDLIMNQNDFIIDSVLHFKVYAKHTSVVNWYSFYGKINTNITVSNNRAPTNNFIWLKNQFRFNKQILTELQNGNSNLASAINAAKNQAHSDAVVAQSQAAQELDTITYDHSGSSAALATNAANIASEAAAADVSFDSIMPNADSALATVAAFDATTFFNQQSSAANFWQQLGNYIMDSGQLGFVATGLVIVTLVSLFVFLLRF